jgi:hypothetical protein
LDAVQSNTFRARESGLRQAILRAVAALSVTVASLLLFMVMPLLPRELMALVAIGLGALAFKFPTPALALMILLAMPGYAYQLGSALPGAVSVPVSMVAAMSVLLLVIAVIAGELGATLGIAAGVIAAVLMMTPLEPLALPLLVATIFVRTKHARVGALLTILTFVILYYPVLALGGVGAPEIPVPVLQRVSFPASPPVPVLSLDEISTRLSRIANSSARQALPYLRSLAEYWPLSPEKRLLPAGFIFTMLAGAAMVAAASILSLFRWLRRREVGGTRLSYLAPVVGMLGGMLAFLVLSSLLARPLDYASVMRPLLIVIGGVVAGGGGSIVEAWLTGRDVTLDFRERLADRAMAVRAGTDLLKNRTEETKALCRPIDTSGEDALRQMCEQELTFTEQAVAEMSLADLQQKATVFDELQGKLREAVRESNARLYKYFDEDWQRYNHCLTLAGGYGFAIGEMLQGPDFAALAAMDCREVLTMQTALNERYQTSARALAEGVEKLAGRIRSEVDPDFKRAGLDIARDYLAQGRYSEGLEEFLQELSEIQYAVGNTVSGLDKEIRAVLDSLKAIVTDVLMPTAASQGDEVSVRYYGEAVGEIDNLGDLPGDKARLPDFMHTVSAVAALGELMASLGSRLGERIASLETSVLDKTPRGYNWSMRPDSLARLAELSPANGRPLGLQHRMSLLKTGPSIVEADAHALRDYSVAHELLINYANVEYLVDEKLDSQAAVNIADLPVSRKYATEYLELYRLKHPGQFRIDRDSGRLTSLSGIPPVETKR